MDEFDAGTFGNEYGSSDGQMLWEILNRSDVVARMETASDLGRPALAAVEDILLQKLRSVIMEDRFKQMAGRMVKQILEQRGYEHEASGIRLNSIPFYKASRYRRRNRTGLYVFRNSSDPRDICLADTRRGEKLPPLQKGRWVYLHHIDSSLKASIGYGFDLQDAHTTVKKVGNFRHRVLRVARPG